MVPEWEWSWKRYLVEEDKIIRGIREQRDWAKHEHEEKGVGMEMSAALKKLRRFRVWKHTGTCAGCGIGRGMYEEGVHTLCCMVEDNVAKAVRMEWERVLCIAGDMSAGELFTYFKKRTGKLKMGGTYIHGCWREFTYWETFSGYKPPVPMGDMIGEARDWLMTRRRLGGYLGEENYAQLVYEETKDFLKKEWRRVDDVPSINEWVEECTWMRGRSGNQLATEVIIDGRRRRTRRMKSVMSAFLADADVAHQLVTSGVEEMHIMQKSEGGKVRAVVKTGNAVNRQMDYISTAFDDGLIGSKASTLWAAGSGGEEIDWDLLHAVEDKRKLKVPLDQSSFDQHQSKPTIWAVLVAVGETLEEAYGEEHDVMKVWRAMWGSIFCRPVNIMLEGKVVGHWENGVPSGWRWTSVLDTLLNLASFKIITRLAEQTIGRPIPVGNHYAQGDDVVFSTNDLGAVEAVVALYGEVGYQVHPEKTFVSRQRAEFLRKSYEVGRIVGYISRGILSIRFRNPIISTPVVAEERLYSRLSTWQLCVLRGADVGRVMSLFLDDAEQLGVKRVDAADFALTPNSFGGGGVPVESRMGAALRREGSGEWKEIRITKEYRRLGLELGKWEKRLDRWGGANRDERAGFRRLLAQMWGIDEVELVKEASGEIVPIRMGVKRYVNTNTVPSSGFPIADRVWDVGGIPKVLVRMFKERCMREGSWAEVVKPEYVALLKRLERRISTGLFYSYMVGDFKCPMPMVDGCGLKYGHAIKKSGLAAIHRILNVRGAGICDYYLWSYVVEKQVRRRLKEMMGTYGLGL